MTKDETPPKSDTPAVGSGLGMLERAWDAQWALRLVCVLLFFDMAMLLHVQRGVWQWSEVGKRLFEDVGWLAVCLVAFSFIVAIVMPALFIVVRHIGSALVLLPWFSTAREDRREGRPLGYVFAGQLRDLALKEKDAFLLRIYEEHESARTAERRVAEKAGDLTAAVLVVGLADWLLGSRIPGGIGLVEVIVQALGSWKGAVIAVGAFCAWVILRSAWFPLSTWNLIYYPPLDRELRDKERKDRLM